ncbi:MULTISPECIES: DUF3352 domain-containing protein [unclassified Synechococcus]|uniref:DUF3352 domain-containing protein n=1 Tax=unclassified Synechococcus TaxID=2626047 RepID=UPI0021A343A2|nr:MULTISPECIES: DUF3352 domain-containing protein [unclassified Synechococcus]MCT0211958.1 DUF3352 domain-containing protein [Synechococcus sp. CS-1326]MCT0232370.1 DUF3352 domain-containing protein [Synechococcus sp. CS-1327]
MKARPFLVLVLSFSLVLLALGLGGWWLVLRQSPLSLQHRSLSMPEAARFVPRSAPLSLHLLVSPDRLASYARAVSAPGKRRQAVAAVEALRDGAFATAGLDYSSELADWLGDEVSLAVLAPEGTDGPTGWFLALRSRDEEGARRFLQHFWQTRSLAGAELQISSYRGMGLISGRGALADQSVRPLATALINDRMVLIASGRGILEQALDVSQIDELNQAANPRLAADLVRLGDGVALLTARPEALVDWLGIPAEIATDPAVVGLVAALSPSGEALRLEADLDLTEDLPPLALAAAPPLLAELSAPASSLVVVQNPAALLSETTTVAAEAWQRLLGPPLRQALAGLAGPLPVLVGANSTGPLIWAQESGGWLLGTSPGAPSVSQIQPALARDGLIAAPLSRAGVPLQVWTRLEARAGRRDADQLLARVAGTRLERNDVAWWGEGLAVLDEQLEGGRPPRQLLSQLAALEAPGAALQVAVADQPGRRLLSRWQPWRLLMGLAGSPLRDSVQGFGCSLEPELDSGVAPALRLHGRLELG